MNKKIIWKKQAFFLCVVILISLISYAVDAATQNLPSEQDAVELTFSYYYGNLTFVEAKRVKAYVPDRLIQPEKGDIFTLETNEGNVVHSFRKEYVTKLIINEFEIPPQIIPNDQFMFSEIVPFVEGASRLKVTDVKGNLKLSVDISQYFKAIDFVKPIEQPNPNLIFNYLLITAAVIVVLIILVCILIKLKSRYFKKI